LQNEISGQWPITKNFYGLGRLTYDSVSNRFLNGLAGFEYDEECWAFRVVVQRFINTSQVTTQQIFFQLDLKGLSGFGNNPINILKFNIPGYSPSNMTSTPKSPFERYE
jgi:LPS-assembly protein